MKAKGTEFDFDFDFAAKPFLWRWHDMIAMLDDESMQYVVEGEVKECNTAVAGGLTGCSLHESMTYDHKRCHADKQHGREPQMRHVWDFILTRADTT